MPISLKFNQHFSDWKTKISLTLIWTCFEPMTICRWYYIKIQNFNLFKKIRLQTWLNPLPHSVQLNKDDLPVLCLSISVLFDVWLEFLSLFEVAMLPICSFSSSDGISESRLETFSNSSSSYRFWKKFYCAYRLNQELIPNFSLQNDINVSINTMHKIKLRNLKQFVKGILYLPESFVAQKNFQVLFRIPSRFQSLLLHNLHFRKPASF